MGRSHITLVIDAEKCRVCGKCLAKTACRGNAIRVLDRGDMPFLDMSRCWGCLVCVPACPFDAVVRHMPRLDYTAKLAELEREHRELLASLPAHSIPASILIRLEDLEDEITSLRTHLD